MQLLENHHKAYMYAWCQVDDVIMSAAAADFTCLVLTRSPENSSVHVNLFAKTPDHVTVISSGPIL